MFLGNASDQKQAPPRRFFRLAVQNYNENNDLQKNASRYHTDWKKIGSLRNILVVSWQFRQFLVV